MDTNMRPGDSSVKPRPTRTDRRHLSSISTQNMSLRDRFELERPRSSHGDTNQKARKHVCSSSTIPSGKYLEERTRRVNEADTDELVKHMSNLPSYLKREVKPQEKAFSVGVLDWGLLEKWQSSKQVPYRSDGSSSSNSIASSLFSTEESSTYSQTGHSSAASHHRHGRFASEASTSDVKSRNVSKSRLGSTAESDMNEALGSSSTTSSTKSEHLRSNDPSISSKGQHHCDLAKQTRRSRRSQSMSLSHKSNEEDEKHVLVRPLHDRSTASVTKALNATSQRNAEQKEVNSKERYSKSHHAEFSCDIPHSCPLPCDLDDQKIRVLQPCRSQEAKSNERETATVSQLGSTGKLIGSLKERSSKDNHHAVKTELSTMTGLPQGSRISKQPVEAANARDLSPTGRFRLRIGSRKLSFTEDTELPQNSSAPFIDKPYTSTKEHTASIEKPVSDKSAAAGKARSSPLKRLLDPLLKSREATHSRSSASLKRDSKPVYNATKMAERPSTAPGGRVGLNLNSDQSTNIHRNEEHKESAVIQALLRVVVQNGCPLFTFAVDSVKDILCAALGKLSSDKTSEDRYLYTFFSIHEIKNRSWMNLRGRGSGHEYSPNVVAQMEVSESRFSRSTGNNFLRQFVLSAVDLKPVEKSDPEYQLNHELAALVVSFPGHSDKYKGTTVILPSGIHTLPSKGKPSSLIERWRSGGQCDCGGWDPGCKLRILTDSKSRPSSSSVKFKLYDEGSVEGNPQQQQQQQPIFSMAPFKDKEGVLSISFSSSISPLQAFSICLAVLDSRKVLKPSTQGKVQEAKSSDEVQGSYFSVPPHSPVGRV